MKLPRVIAYAFATVLSVVSLIVSAEEGSAQMRDGPGWGCCDFWQPGWMRHRDWGPRRSSPDMRARMQRHWTFMHVGIPKAFEGARSTIRSTPANLKQGGELYDDNCASCHGKTGLGDGEAGKSLTPSPALLSWMIQRPIAVDEYLLWTISEGGKKFGTDMPAFKDTLTKEEIWKIVAFMRSGFPAPSKK